ncbi:MAG: hypothetical protein ABJC05_01790 [Pyrinomonadaceae bacterium]
MNFKLITTSIMITLWVAAGVFAQQAAPPESNEKRAALTELAGALDARGSSALEGRLLTTMLNGAPDSPVTNVRLVIRNAGVAYYTYISGWATFYAGDGVRCGEGLFKLDALAPGESAETDTPGLRLRCAPATWRIVATNLLTRMSDTAKANEAQSPEGSEGSSSTQSAMTSPSANLLIAIDGEEHPIQLNHPLVVKLGNRQRTIVIRAAP